MRVNIGWVMLKKRGLMMPEKRLIYLSESEKCWLLIGIILGVLFTFIFFYVYTYLPAITEIQRAGLIGLISGGALVYFIQKIEWGVDDD